MIAQRVILDNTTEALSVGDWLRSKIVAQDTLRFLSAYFSLHGYETMAGSFLNTRTRFLFGDPGNVGNLDPAPGMDKSFSIVTDGLRSDNPLSLKWIARDCKKWVENPDTQIRKVGQNNFLHGKMYHLRHADGTSESISGSSNFTKRGLGGGRGSNLELNLISDNQTTDELEKWFDAIWEKSESAKQDVLQALNKLGEDRSPEFIYFKTLFHLFENRLNDETQAIAEIADYDQTEIWKKLYPFQIQGAKGALSRLLQHNGCIIADSVGLGKTYTALAIIKYFEMRNENVLVLCPKRLSENWRRYQSSAGDINNPLEKDKFQYRVLSHTDLGRESGMSGNIDLSTFNWANHSLVVIDESHNFRNAPSISKSHDGDAPLSRYEFLMEKVLKPGVPTKVLMLSATPVNNSLRDLRSQINLISAGNDNYFHKGDMDIPSINRVIINAQSQFTRWQNSPADQRDKESLLNNLHDDFFRLLDGLTIARSRQHILKFYPEFFAWEGFPQRNEPINHRPKTDTNGELKYHDMADMIQKFQLAIYHPADYLDENSEKFKQLVAEKKMKQFNQRDRERHLIYMLKINFLKRLESSIHAFGKTVSRTIDKIDTVLEKISRHGGDGQVDVELSDVQIEDEYLFEGKKWQYRLEDLDLLAWQSDLESDKQVLSDILLRVKRITSDRDGKLQLLKKQITGKINNPTIDKHGRQNRKILIFTTFADTAGYLYDECREFAAENGFSIAKITGSSEAKTSIGKANYQEILNRFAPHGREHNIAGEEQIDVLIATDCISEGQNLQDCDAVINYDIHWNPVRLVQRFGRIDRLNSDNRSLSMINFWPPLDLEEYLSLEKRVRDKMEIVNIAATGSDNILRPEGYLAPDDADLDYRAKQIQKIHNEPLNLVDSQEGEFDISDFTLDDFLKELKDYLEKNRAELENAPMGLFSLVPTGAYRPGIIFFLRRHQGALRDAPVTPGRLFFIGDDNLILAGKHVLTTLRKLARDRTVADYALAGVFDMKTNNGADMREESEKVKLAINAYSGQKNKDESERSLVTGLLPSRESSRQNVNDYELVTWLVIVADDQV